MILTTHGASKLSRKSTTKAGTEKYRFAAASRGAATVTLSRKPVAKSTQSHTWRLVYLLCGASQGTLFLKKARLEPLHMPGLS